MWKRKGGGSRERTEREKKGGRKGEREGQSLNFFKEPRIFFSKDSIRLSFVLLANIAYL